MSRRLLLLNGLAILAVVVVHAAIWGEITISWSTGYPFAVENCAQIGTITYWSLTIIEGLLRFIVPVFLFTSGFFISYTARGSQSPSNWKVVIVRLKNIIAPYIIWSVITFVIDALQGVVFSPSKYLLLLLCGGAEAPYYYVPLLCQFYLLSPLMISMAKNKGKWLLLISALIQLGMTGLIYYLSMMTPTSDSNMALQIAKQPLFPRWLFFFSFGLVSSFHRQRLRQLVRHKWWLLAAVLVLAPLSIVESETLYHMTGDAMWRTIPVTISATFYAIAFILCFLAFDWIPSLFSKPLYQLNKKIFGIYLIHWKVIEFSVLAIVSIAPWVVSRQMFLQPILIILGVSVPFVFMEAVAKSRVKRFYRYLFG